MARTPIQVHGHRGARAMRPENTLPAFEYAITVHADVLELDLAVTRDDVLVVSHDPVLNPEICQSPGGSRVIRELTVAELSRWDCGSLRNPQFPKQQPAPGARIPTLEQVLDLASRGSFHFNIETKISPEHPEYTPSPERFAALLLQILRKRKLEHRVIVQSFDFRTLQAMQRMAPEIRLSALFEDRDRSFVEVSRESGAKIVSPQHRLITEKQVQAAHHAGLQVVPWTANTPADWERLINAQVDGIITDDPAALITFLESRGLR